MQTFLPFPDFSASARVLDRARLGKQRLEGLDIDRRLEQLEAGAAPSSVSWSGHPAVRMWLGHRRALLRYTLIICDEWIRRKYRDTRRPILLERLRPLVTAGYTAAPPAWFGDEAVHRSHRAVLLGKKPDWYQQWGWAEQAAVLDEKGRWPYKWPVPLKGETGRKNFDNKSLGAALNSKSLGAA